MQTSIGPQDLTVLVFALDGHLYGIPAKDLREITRAALPSRLAQAPYVIEGFLNLRGRIAAVLDMRARFQLPLTPLSAQHVFLICELGPRLLALRVDRVIDLIEVDARALVEPSDLSPAALHMQGVVALPDGLLVLSDLQTFLSRAEDEALTRALSALETSRAEPP